MTPTREQLASPTTSAACAFCGGPMDCAGRCSCYPHPRQPKRGFAERPAPPTFEQLRAHHARMLESLTR